MHKNPRSVNNSRHSFATGGNQNEFSNSCNFFFFNFNQLFDQKYTLILPLYTLANEASGKEMCKIFAR